MYKGPTFESVVDMADRLIKFGGPGHTSVLYTNPLNSTRIDYFGSKVSHGCVGESWVCVGEPWVCVRLYVSHGCM